MFPIGKRMTYLSGLSVLAGFVLLFDAAPLLPNPDFALIKLIIAALSVIIGIGAYYTHKLPWVYIMGFVVIIYNPFWFFALDRWVWILIHLLTAVVFFFGSRTLEPAKGGISLFWGPRHFWGEAIGPNTEEGLVKKAEAYNHFLIGIAESARDDILKSVRNMAKTLPETIQKEIGVGEDFSREQKDLLFHEIMYFLLFFTYQKSQELLDKEKSVFFIKQLRDFMVTTLTETYVRKKREIIDKEIDNRSLRYAESTVLVATEKNPDAKGLLNLFAAEATARLVRQENQPVATEIEIIIGGFLQKLQLESLLEDPKKDKDKGADKEKKEEKRGINKQVKQAMETKKQEATQKSQQSAAAEKKSE